MPDEQHLVPRSGQILGATVRALKLELPKELSKNAQRYFGGVRVRLQTEQQLHREIAEALAADPDFAVPAIRKPVADILTQAIAATSANWDDLAALVETVIPTDTPVPLDEIVAVATPTFLCLSAVDLSLRLGALHHLLGKVPTASEETWAWAKDEHGGMLLRRWIKQAGLTRDLLMERTRLGATTVDAWLDGQRRPETDNLATLARVLAPLLKRSRDELGRVLARHFALAAVAAKLASIAGREQLADAAAFLSGLTVVVHRFLEESSLKGAMRRDALLHMVYEGTRFDGSAFVVNTMRRVFGADPYWRSIFDASTGNWHAWMMFTLSQAINVVKAARLAKDAGGEVEDPRRVVRFNLSDLLTPPDETYARDWFVKGLDGPAQHAAFYWMQGERLLGLERLAMAADCFRRAVSAGRGNPQLHYRLGCALWHAALEDPTVARTAERAAWFTDGERELWLAVQIAEAEGEKWEVPPVWDLPLIELGWLMLETGRGQECLAHAAEVVRRVGTINDRVAFFVAHAHFNVGDHAAALARFEECRRLNPRHQLALEGIEACRAGIRELRRGRPGDRR